MGRSIFVMRNQSVRCFMYTLKLDYIVLYSKILLHSKQTRMNHCNCFIAVIQSPCGHTDASTICSSTANIISRLRIGTLDYIVYPLFFIDGLKPSTAVTHSSCNGVHPRVAVAWTDPQHYHHHHQHQFYQ